MNLSTGSITMNDLYSNNLIVTHMVGLPVSIVLFYDTALQPHHGPPGRPAPRCSY